MSRMWFLAAALAAVLFPVAAWAAGGWQWPVGSSVSLGYGAAYVAVDGRTCTHGGVDIPAPAGAAVRACAGGTVAFAGLVPAGAGRRAYAVTIATADGLRATLLPLERVSVHAGQSLSAGDVLGELAADGDGSSPEPHLHLGAKRGSAAIDPLALLEPVSSPAPPGPAPRPPAVKPPTSPSPGQPVRNPAPQQPVGPRLPVAPRAPVAPRVPVAPPVRAAARVPGVAPAPLAAGPAMEAPLGPADTAAMHEAAGVAARAAAVRPEATIRTVAVPVVPRLASFLSAAVRARAGVEWLVLRALVLAGALLCLRRVLASLGRTATSAVPAAVHARRARG